MYSIPVPTSLTEENEFAVPLTKLYLTISEVSLALLVGLPIFLLAAVISGGINLASMATLFVYFYIAAIAMESLRKNRPASWIWDLRYQYGMVPEQRGWMRCLPSSPRRIIYPHHVCGIHAFLGQKKLGDRLACGTYAMTLFPPGAGPDPEVHLLSMKPVVLPRAHKRIHICPKAAASVAAKTAQSKAGKAIVPPVTEGGFPAPIWYSPPDGFAKGALGHEDIVHCKVVATSELLVA